MTPPFNAMLKRQIHVFGYKLSNLRDVKASVIKHNQLRMVNVLTMDVVIQVGKGVSDKFVHLNALVQALGQQ